MTSRERQLNVKQGDIKKNYTAQSPKNDNDESVDDMLANVDQFIEGVYRDLSLSPPMRSIIDNNTTFRTSMDDDSSSSATTSPAGSSQLSETTIKRESTPVSLTGVRRNMDTEIERINQICNNVDQNLRSIGLFMNNYSSNRISDDLSNTTSSTTPSSSTSIIIVNNTSPKRIRKHNMPLDPEVSTPSPTREVAQVIDLSNSLTQTQTQPPETRRLPVLYNDDNDDDDVILVSADIPSVVDLCTPDSHRQMPPARSSVNYQLLNRRRLSHNDDVDVEDPCYEGPSSTRRRRTESSSRNNPCEPEIKSNIGNRSATNNSGQIPFMCPVCMESCIKHQPTSTICGHVFCKHCIENAICYTHKCPMCNKKISKKHTFRIYL